MLTRHGRFTRWFLVLVAVALLGAACGDDDSPGTIASGSSGSSTPDGSASPAGDGSPTEGLPERIVSLSPTATEMLFAIGAGDQVVAVDEFSDYPAEAPTTDLSGIQPNVEALVGYEPDLVVIQYDPGDLVASMDAAGIPTMVLPAAASLDDAYDQLEQLGTTTGHAAEAAAVVADMRTRIEALVASVPERDEPLTYFHELDDTLFSVTSSTFVGQVYALAGLENVADAADPDGALGGYPQVSAELLLDADPDLYFLADTKCCGQDAEALAGRPGFDQLRAARNGDVIELDDDVASRWGPRVVEFLDAIVTATAAVEAPA